MEKNMRVALVSGSLPNPEQDEAYEAGFSEGYRQCLNAVETAYSLAIKAHMTPQEIQEALSDHWLRLRTFEGFPPPVEVGRKDKRQGTDSAARVAGNGRKR